MIGFKPLPAFPTPAGEASRGLLTQPPASMGWASLGSGGNSLNFFGVVDGGNGGDVDGDSHDEEGGQSLALLLTYFSDQGSPGGQECVYYHPVPRLGTAWT